jgi:hypothetical protein
VIDLLFGFMAALLLMGILIPLTMKPKLKETPSCTSNLKQVSLFFQMWANEHGGKFPMAVSTNKGGTLEHGPRGEVFEHFAALSEDMFTPKLLVCPADKGRSGLDVWTADFNNQNVSYFAGLDAEERVPSTILCGDRDITGGVLSVGNVLLFMSNSVPKWKGAVHKQSGNLGFSDGSVQQFSEVGLQGQFQRVFQGGTCEVVRLGIP